MTIRTFLICNNYIFCIGTNYYIRIMSNKNNLPIFFLRFDIFNQFLIYRSIIQTIFRLVYQYRTFFITKF